jgi:phage terminase large subunit-like protein
LALADLSGDLETLQQQLSAAGMAASFPWSLPQEAALRAATDVIAFIAGNQSGKSTAGLGIISRFVRREGPIYARIRNKKRPLEIWVVPKNFEKVRSLWVPRLQHEVFAGMDYTVRQAPEHIFTWKDKYGGGKVLLKSQDQHFLSFESSVVDLAVCDEEIEDRRIYSSIQTRFSTTNGVIVLLFTPLLGFTYTYDELVAPIMKDEYKIADNVWRRGNELTLITAGMSSNPAAVAGGGVARILNDPSLSDAERNARLYGTFGFTEGLIFPAFADLAENVPDNTYLIDKLPDDRSYSWLLTADPNKRHAALLIAFDGDGNRFVCAEHYRENLPDSEHAKFYGFMLKRFKLSQDDVEIWADPGGAGAQSILNLAEVGYFARAVPKDAGSVSASIKLIRRHAWIDSGHKHPVTGKMGAPHIFFLRNLSSTWKELGIELEESRLMWELRQYRQKVDAAPDTPVKRRDDAVDCLRYGEIVRMAEPDTPVSDPIKAARKRLDDSSKHEAELYDKLLSRLAGGGNKDVVKPC